MSYTFGGATADDITWALTATGDALHGARNGARFYYGWWYPTTLTAGRGLWSGGNTFGAEIDATTSELLLRADHTTDSSYVTTGAGLTVDAWKFLAFMFSEDNTGPVERWRVWGGTAETPPAEITVTNVVSPVGNITGNANFYLGNKGTGTVAFQGDIDEAGYITQVAIGAPFNLAAQGAITDAEALAFYERVVFQVWEGRETGATILRGTSLTATTAEAAHLSLSGLPIMVDRWQNGALLSELVPTINGATYSERRAPRRYTHRAVGMSGYMGQGF